MKRLKLFLILSTIFFVKNLYAQEGTDILKVLIIENLDDKVFDIRALTNSNDTIRILSAKQVINDNSCYKKIKIGNKYTFDLSAKPMYTDNLVVRVGNKIYWKTGDKISDLPYFADNIKSNYIRIPNCCEQNED